MERVSQLLSMLTDELDKSAPSQVKKFFKQEIKFAQDKICQRDLYNASEKESKYIEQKDQKRKQTEKAAI